jgi:hypothetical protein
VLRFLPKGVDVRGDAMAMESIAAQLIVEAASQSVKNLVPGADALISVLQALRERYKKAERTYEATRGDADSDFETRRSKLMERLGVIQSRILFEVSDPALVARIAPFFIEQAAALLEAATVSSLAALNLNFDQIEAVLDRNRASMRARSRARTLVVFMSTASIGAIAILCVFSSKFELTSSSAIPLLDIPVTVILWSALGSIAAMLYRFNNSSVAELSDPLRWSFTRPLTGIFMGIIAYLAIKVGMLVAHPSIKGSVEQPQLLWLVSFLAGFSDRMSESVLKVLGNKISGGRLNELVTMDAPAGLLGGNLGDILDRMGWSKKAKPSEASAGTVTTKRSEQGKRREAKPAEGRKPVKPNEDTHSGTVVPLESGSGREQH